MTQRSFITPIEGFAGTMNMGKGRVAPFRQRKPRQLMDIAQEARIIIDRARKSGVVIDDGNVVDLLADNIPHVSLSDLRSALAVCGLGHQFSNKTLGCDPESRGM